MKLFWFLENDPGKLSAEDVTAGLSGSRAILWITAFAVIAFGMWANFAKIDQITRAQGSIISSSRTQVIQSEGGGTLDELLVKEGDVVERGQVLVRLERARAEAAYLETRARAAALSATVSRLRAEVFGGKPQFATDTQDYKQFRDSQSALLRKRRAAFDQDMKSQQHILDLIEQELTLNRPLMASGDVSRTEILRLERQAADVAAQMAARRNKYLQDCQAELNKAEEDYTEVEQVLAQKKLLLDQTELVAPMNGVVKNVRITTRGGVVRAGEEVMQIVPLEDNLVIEARVKPADIAFIKLGYPATVKIDAYDYTIYGDLSGELIFISADTLTEGLRENEQPYYRVRVRTQGRRFSARPDEDLEIQPGMTATVEIKTGSNTVLHYLVKPVVKTLSEAMGER